MDEEAAKEGVGVVEVAVQETDQPDLLTRGQCRHAVTRGHLARVVAAVGVGRGQLLPVHHQLHVGVASTAVGTCNPASKGPSWSGGQFTTSRLNTAFCLPRILYGHHRCIISSVIGIFSLNPPPPPPPMSYLLPLTTTSVSHNACCSSTSVSHNMLQ